MSVSVLVFFLVFLLFLFLSLSFSVPYIAKRIFVQRSVAIRYCFFFPSRWMCAGIFLFFFSHKKEAWLSFLFAFGLLLLVVLRFTF